MPRQTKSNTDLSVRRIGDAGIVDAEGRITLGEGVRLLRTTLQQLAEEVPGRIVINMAGISHIDSAGLGALASSHIELKPRGGLRLVAVQPRVREILDMTKLSSVIQLHSTEQEALQVCSDVAADASLPLDGGEAERKQIS